MPDPGNHAQLLEAAENLLRDAIETTGYSVIGPMNPNAMDGGEQDGELIWICRARELIGQIAEWRASAEQVKTTEPDWRAEITYHGISVKNLGDIEICQVNPNISDAAEVARQIALLPRILSLLDNFHISIGHCSDDVILNMNSDETRELNQIMELLK